MPCFPLNRQCNNMIWPVSKGQAGNSRNSIPWDFFNLKAAWLYRWGLTLERYRCPTPSPDGQNVEFSQNLFAWVCWLCVFSFPSLELLSVEGTQTSGRVRRRSLHRTISIMYCYRCIHSVAWSGQLPSIFEHDCRTSTHINATARLNINEALGFV